MCLATIDTNEKISFAVDSNIDLALQMMVPDSISAAERFIELNPTCSIDVKLAKSFSQVKLNFNDPRKNSVAYGTTCFEKPQDFENWTKNMRVIASESFANLISDCFEEYYQEDGSINRMAILPLEKALRV